MGLYQTLTMAARECGIEWFVAILDMPVFRMIRWKLHLIFAGYEGVAPMPYLGSAASIPAWCDVVMAERRLAETDQDLHAILVQGIGLEAALRPVDLTRVDRLVAWRHKAASGQQAQLRPAAAAESRAKPRPRGASRPDWAGVQVALAASQPSSMRRAA